MKKLLFYWLIICCMQLSSQELLLHYNFDNNTNDSSGNNYNGSPSGVVFVEDRNGNPNSAVSFDGINDFIDLPNLSELKPNLPVSFSFWIKYESNLVTDRVVFNTSFEEDVNSGIYLTTQSSTGKLAVGYGDGSSSFTSSNRRGYLSNNVIQSNSWHQIHIVIISSNNMKVYLDCVETGGAYSGSGGNLVYSSLPGSLGRHDQNNSAVNSYYFKGVLDDFKYYKGIITPTVNNTIFDNLETTLCEGTSYNLPTISSNGIQGVWSPAFDNTKIGITKYTFKPNTGQCASIVSHDLEIKEKSIPSFSSLETILCEGSSYNLPTTSTNGLTGTWFPEFDNTKIGTTVYSFTPNESDCIEKFSHSIEITKNLSPVFNNLETTLCEGVTYNLPTTSTNGVTGTWSPAFDNTKIGNTTYTFKSDTDQCASVFKHDIEITSKLTPSFSSLETILCEGSSYNLPTTSSNGLTGTWSPEFDNTKIGTTVYSFTPNESDCIEKFSHSIEITKNLSPVFNNLETTLCEGTSYNLPTTSTNGVTGTWSPAFDNTKTGKTTYTFISDTDQCASVFNHDIEITSKLTPSFSSLETILCEGSSYNLPTTSTNGIPGSWLPVFNGDLLGIAQYTFTPNTGQCANTFTHSIEITEKKPPTFTNLRSILCVGDSYNLPTTSSDGITGSWSPSFDSSTIGTTKYTFTPNANQCATFLEYTIEIANEINPTFSSLETIVCEGSSYNLPTISSNGVTGTWFPEFDSSVIGITSYTFTPTSSSCANTYKHSIEIKSELVPSFTNLETILCEGTSYTLPVSSSNGLTGTWLPTFDNTKIGITEYTFTVNNAKCAISYKHSIEITAKLKPNFEGLETVLCVGSSYNLPTISRNGIIGTWLPAFDNSTIGKKVYTFTPNAAECASTFSYSIEITDEVLPSFSDLKTTLCLGSSYSLPTTSSNGIKGSWLPIFDNTTIGNTRYTFTPDLDQCASSFSYTLEIIDKIVPSFADLKTKLCVGDSYNLPMNSSNGISGTWSPILDTTKIGATVYTFTPNSGECANTFRYSLEITDEVLPIFTDLETTLCVNSTYILPTISSNGISGTWSPNFDSTRIGVTTYTFSPDVEQCASFINHSITINQKISPIFLSLPNFLIKNTSYDLPNQSDNGILGTWNPIFDNSEVGIITYTFTPNDMDCTNIFTYTVQTINHLTIPLYFTPNNDNVNDYWKIEGLESYSNISLLIFNRYGKLLAKPEVAEGWDGLYNGKKMPPNDYWFHLTAINLNNEVIIKKGHFSLLR